MLSSERCSAMMRDPEHLFRRMWAAQGWGKWDDQSACYERSRHDHDKFQSADDFFLDALTGAQCNSNWYDGNWQMPKFHFLSEAPALLGFDDEIQKLCRASLPEGSRDFTNQDHLGCYAARYADLRERYCHKGMRSCDWYQLYNHWEEKGKKEKRRFECTHADLCGKASLNILSLVDGGELRYNMCRNLEWQVCAARGQLPGQRIPAIKFAVAPKELDLGANSPRSLGKCGGWHPQEAPSDGVFGYTNDDIYFLEVCVFNEICKNSRQLFSVEADETFMCDFSPARFSELESILREPPVAPQPSRQVWKDTKICTRLGPRVATARDFESFSSGAAPTKGPAASSYLSSVLGLASKDAATRGASAASAKGAGLLGLDKDPPGPPPPPPPVVTKSAVTCGQCWEINAGRGSCAAVRGCNAALCDFCTNP